MTRARTLMLVAALALAAPASANATTTFTWTPQELKAANDAAGGSISLYTRTYNQGGVDYTFPAFSVSGPCGLAVLSKLSIKRIAKSGLRIRVTCPTACTVSATLTTARALARALRLGRSRRLASGRKTLLAAGSATVTLKVSRKAVRRFRRLRKATVKLNVAIKGRDGRTTRVARTLRLKR